MRQYQSEDVKELVAGLAAVHSEMAPAKKDTVNPHFKSTYADIRSVVEVSRPLLSAQGIVVNQIVDYEGENVFLVTQVLHKSGQWMRSWYPVRPTKQDPQSLGSAITYARRYAYCAIVGVVADDDDDGAEASKKGVEKAPVPKGEFDTPQLREQFVSNCVSAIKNSPNLEDLRGQRTLNLAKWNAMKVSECEADITAFNAIIAAYNPKLTHFRDEAEKAKKPPATVESAKQGPLGDDEIVF